MSKSRAERLAAFEKWASRAKSGELKVGGRSQEIVDKLEDTPEAGDEAAGPTNTVPAG